MSQLKLTPPVIEMISERFKALAEPARLQILSCLRRGEMTVTELVEETGLGQANVSKHLQSLFAAKFVDRRKDGLFTYYARPTITTFTPSGVSTYAASWRTSLVQPAFDHNFASGGSVSPMNSFT